MNHYRHYKPKGIGTWSALAEIIVKWCLVERCRCLHYQEFPNGPDT